MLENSLWVGCFLLFFFLKKGVLSGAPGISTFRCTCLASFLSFSKGVPASVLGLEFGGIFAPGAIAGNLPLSAVQHRADFLSSP